MLAPVLPWMSNGTLHAFLKNKGKALTVVERLQLVNHAILILIGGADHSQVHAIGSGLKYCAFSLTLRRPMFSNFVICGSAFDSRVSRRLA